MQQPVAVSRAFSAALTTKIFSGSNIIWIHLAGDEGRAERAIDAVMKQRKELKTFVLHTWDALDGASWAPVRPGVTGPAATRSEALRDPLNALNALTDRYDMGSVPDQNCITIMRDLHKMLNDERHFGLRRCILQIGKEGLLNLHKRVRPIVILADTPTPHADIREYCDVIEFALPSAKEMQTDVVDWIWTCAHDTEKATKQLEIPPLTPDMRDRLTQALLGTSAQEAARILSFAFATSLGFNEKNFDVIAREKSAVIQKVEGLKFIPADEIPPITHFGGFGAFTQWLERRGRLYSRHARELQQELPRGCVLIGPPGTGKTEVAKAAARVLGLDLLIMDIGALFDKFVGGTEKKIRAAIQTVDALPQCLLMVDV
jgi:hypothetical protein